LRCLFLVILSFILIVAKAQDETFLSVDKENISFEDLVEYISSETGMRVYLPEDQTPDIVKSISLDSASVKNALEYFLLGSKFKVSEWNNSFVILSNENLIRKIPIYVKEEAERGDAKDILNTKSEDRYIQGRKSDVMATFDVGDKNIHSSGKIRISGKILDMDNGEPIIGATVYIEETKSGAASDLHGYFAIVLPRGNYNAQFSSMGYEPRKCYLNVYSNGRISVKMEQATVSLLEAVIFGDRQMDIKRKDPGLEKISLDAIKSIPMMMGEKDVIKVSEMLPGIVNVGEGSSGLNVRGGSSDQNAFYINRVPVYNASHLFGFFPAFNSDIIKDFSIYKGFIPAEFGGRLSSVFNITTKQGNKHNFNIHGGTNPFSSKVTIEGPIVKEKSSVLLSARSSFSDWILAAIDDPIISESGANFNDVSFYLDKHSDNSVISAFVYTSNDKFNLSDINSYEYSNRGGSLNLYHDFNSLFRVNMSMIASQYKFSTIDMQNVSTAYEHSYSIKHYEFRADFIQTINESNSLYFGINGILYNLDRGSVLPYGVESLRMIVDHGKENGLETALYISDKYDVTSWLDITAGLRYSLFAPLGSDDIYTYYEDQPREAAFINDTLFFQNNQAIKWYKSPEFRLSLNFKTDPNGTIKIAFNQMSQNLFMLNNTVAIAPNTQWKLADYHIKPALGNQVSAGIFRNIFDGKLETSIELFYKKTSNYTEFKDGADFLSNPLIETAVLQGDQESYGIEFLLKKKTGRFNGWLAYTYSRSFVEVDGENSWNQINYGNVYSSNYDIPNVINAVLNYSFSKRITLSSVITYQQGRPVTYPISNYYFGNISVIDYFERNKYRIPDYFRTDISLTLEGNLKKNKLIHSSWMLSVYNVTGRNNAYSVYFQLDKAVMKSYKYSVIGIPFVTATWLFKFGNYASH